MTFTPEVWDGVLRRLRHHVPSFSYEAWLEPLEARPREQGLLLVCPSSFHRERIRNHYLPGIHACLREEMGDEAGTKLIVELGVRARRAGAELRIEIARKTTIDVGSGTSVDAAIDSTTDVSTDVSREAVARIEGNRPERGNTKPREARRAPRPHPSHPASADDEPTGLPAAEKRSADSNPNPAEPATHTFDTFVVGPCNALAREAALAVARDQQRTLSQLYLCAAPGMGKTHLARAVATEANQHGTATVRYVSAETFTNQFLSALRTHRTSEFKNRYRGRRQLLVVEDIQFLEKKDATQLEFFHTVTHVLDAGGRVVLTGDRMPDQMPYLSQRLRSQLMGGFVAELESPDAQVRRGILRTKAAHGGWRLPIDCLDLLVESVVGSARDLEGVLIQVVTTAALTNRPIDLELTEKAITQKCPAKAPRVTRLTVAEIICTVATVFQTTPEQLASRSRRRQVLLPRQIAMYLCRRYTDASVAEIGEALGRDHPAVRNAILKIERAVLEKPKVRYQLEAVMARIEERLCA